MIDLKESDNQSKLQSFGPSLILKNFTECWTIMFWTVFRI